MLTVKDNLENIEEYELKYQFPITPQPRETH